MTSLTNLLPTLNNFIRVSLKQLEQQYTFLIISLLFLMIIVSGTLHDTTITVYTYLIADMITIFSFLLILWGVMFVIKSVIIKGAKLQDECR